MVPFGVAWTTALTDEACEPHDPIATPRYNLHVCRYARATSMTVPHYTMTVSTYRFEQHGDSNRTNIGFMQSAHTGIPIAEAPARCSNVNSSSHREARAFLTIRNAVQ